MDRMKYFFFLGLVLTSLLGFSQSTDYKVVSYKTEGQKAPNTHYIGEAWLNPVIHGDSTLGYNITKATIKKK